MTKVIMNILTVASGLIKVEVPKRLLCFGENNVNIFQDVRNGVTIQIQECYVPFFFGIRYMAHQTNLAIQKRFHLPTVTTSTIVLLFFFLQISKTP
jgi:hypothetical protein